jgi:hypothetical protein
MQARGGGSALGARYHVDAAAGAKMFAHEKYESMVVGQAALRVDRALFSLARVSLSSFVKSKGQRSGARSYVVESNEGSVLVALPFGVLVEGGAQSDVFFSLDAPAFSALGAGPRAAIAYDVNGREQLALDVDAGVRAFPFLAARAEDQAIVRADVPLRAELSVTSSRRVFVRAGYAALRHMSNAQGESFTRHRVTLLVGFRLPLALLVGAQAALQLTQYDDGISLGQQLFLADDDESQNHVALTLSRRFPFATTVEGRLAWYGNELAKERLSFSRTVASIGMRFGL